MAPAFALVSAAGLNTNVSRRNFGRFTPACLALLNATSIASTVTTGAVSMRAAFSAARSAINCADCRVKRCTVSNCFSVSEPNLLRASSIAPANANLVALLSIHAASAGLASFHSCAVVALACATTTARFCEAIFAFRRVAGDVLKDNLPLPLQAKHSPERTLM